MLPYCPRCGIGADDGLTGEQSSAKSRDAQGRVNKPSAGSIAPGLVEKARAANITPKDHRHAWIERHMAGLGTTPKGGDPDHAPTSEGVKAFRRLLGQ